MRPHATVAAVSGRVGDESGTNLVRALSGHARGADCSASRRWPLFRIGTLPGNDRVPAAVADRRAQGGGRPIESRHGCRPTSTPYIHPARTVRLATGGGS